MIRSQIQPSHDKKNDFYAPSILNHMADQVLPEISAETAQNVLYTFSLGLEIKCARCHDHPIEPISNENYYEVMMPFLNEFRFPKDLKALPGRIRTNPPFPPKKFLSIYEGTDSKKPFDSVSDLGDWLSDTQKGVGYYSARVFVDHIWRYIFGKGLVEQAGNFGSTSPEPRYLELLNWLTYDFIEHDTSINYLIHKMLTSATFQSSSTLYQTRLMNGENIRDNILKISGVLDYNSNLHPL